MKDAFLRSNVHTHSTFCDGKNTVQEMAAAASSSGFVGLGFSGHSPALFDPSCPGISDEAAYRAEVDEMRRKYDGKMSILCGVEQDYYAPVCREDYDYLIGTVHYLPGPQGMLVAIDNTHEEILDLRSAVFSGDGLSVAKSFFELSVENVARYKPDIVGHFDLVVKHNQGGSLFDENSPIYKNAALQAIDAVADIILPYGGIVEVNTGGMARGYRDTPYPDIFILEHLAQRNARVMLSSDSHSVSTLNYGFDKVIEILRAVGFKSVALLQDGYFKNVKI